MKLTFPPSVIKDYRNRMGMTQLQFARELGVTLDTIKAYESPEDGRRFRKLPPERHDILIKLVKKWERMVAKETQNDAV